MFKNLISETEEFATVIRWLVNRGVPVNEILQTQLLHDFIGYHLFDLNSAKNAVHYLYELLNQFPEMAELRNSSAVNLLCGVLGEQLSRKTMISAFNFSTQQGQIDTLKQLSETENFQFLSNKQITLAIEQAVINGYFEVTKFRRELSYFGSFNFQRLCNHSHCSGRSKTMRSKA